MLSKINFVTRFPIQQKYYATLYEALYRQVKVLIQYDEKAFSGSDLDQSSRTKIFTYAFSGLSCRLEIVSRISALILNQLMKVNGPCKSIEELLSVDGQFFFNNIFAKLRYFASSLSDKHVLFCLASLSEYAPQRTASLLIPLLELVIQNVDSAMLLLDQSKILLALDALITMSNFIRKHSILVKDMAKDHRLINESILPEPYLENERL